jgi:hypothetical protein
MVVQARKRKRGKGLSYDRRDGELKFMKYRFCITSLKMSRFTSV